MDDEAMKAMAKRIAQSVVLREGNVLREDMADAVLAAIIETRDRDAALVEHWGETAATRGPALVTRQNIAAAIRSGQQFRKDV